MMTPKRSAGYRLEALLPGDVCLGWVVERLPAELTALRVVGGERGQAASERPIGGRDAIVEEPQVDRPRDVHEGNVSTGAVGVLRDEPDSRVRGHDPVGPGYRRRAVR